MSDGKKKDPLIEWMFIVGGLIILYFVIAYAFGPILAKFWWNWQHIKAEAFGIVYENSAVLDVRKAMETPRNWAEVSVFQSIELANRINRYWWFLLSPVIVYVAWEISKANPLKGLKHKHSMKTLIESEASIWPHVQPIIKLNLIEEDIEKGAWAGAQNPVEFALRYKLLRDGQELDKERTTKVFTSQLSQVWAGPEKLSPIFKVFFVVFAAHGNWDGKNPKYAAGKKEARATLNRLAKTFYESSRRMKKDKFEWADELLEKHSKHPAVIEITNKHAYTHTVMMSMLEYARKNGVLASSEFFWLRAIDRMLWYSLNNVGRNVAWTEVGGIYGHWLAEKIADAALVRPYVQKAVEAYADALKNIKIKPSQLKD
jgi:intracellular multiplication protein IcmP